MTIEDVTPFLTNPNIAIIGFRAHRKASEEYIDVIFRYPDSMDEWQGSIPFHYRRAGLEIYEPEELARLIESLYDEGGSDKRAAWVTNQQELWNTKYAGREVTKLFFLQLLNLRWNCIRCDLPRNPNSQRRIQDIKEAGYLLATNTGRFCPTCLVKTTQHLLVPGYTSVGTGYETIPKALGRRIIEILGSKDAYENRVVPAASRDRLLPDHKFPEIRWDADTMSENLDAMTEQEIRNKFQLLDNQRNQQKREICRNCYQSGKRGIIYGIAYYLTLRRDRPAVETAG